MKENVTEYKKIIDDPNAPERLRGLTITMILTEGYPKGELRFDIDVPDDLTPNESAYLRYSIGEYVDDLKKCVPDMDFSEQRAEFRKDETK